ncbi:hypothetical protein [Halolamina rubra]|uniref:hypothetical protein n=1 Tax=Halolamina rubra TaxID=1380430 RepID=UPI000678704D|nr:hypothetical protein [Halolamina rubra]
MSDATESDADEGKKRSARPQSPLARRARAFARRFRRNRLAMGGLVVTGGFVLLALLAPILAPYDPAAVDVPARLQGPSLAHPFGTDRYGRDLFSRVLYGARIALQVAVATPLVAGASASRSGWSRATSAAASTTR